MEGGFTPRPVGYAGPKLKPMNLGDVIGGAFEIYGKSMLQMWQIVALIVIPITILEVVIIRVSIPSGVRLVSGSFQNPDGTSATVSASIFAVFPLGLLGTWLSTGALFHLQLDTYLGRAHSVEDSLAYFGHRALQLIGLGLLVLISVAIGFVLLIIPGIYLAVGLSVAFPVLMLEGIGGFSAMSRSMGLVRGHWWPTFGRLIVAYLIYGLWTRALQSIGGAIGHGITSVTGYEIVQGVAGAIGLIIAFPFITAVINLIYLDLRVRNDGLTDDDLLERPRDPAHTVPGLSPTAPGPSAPPGGFGPAGSE